MERQHSAFDVEKYVDILRKHGCSEGDLHILEGNWFQPWRVYHGMFHLITLLTLIEKYDEAHPGLSEEEYEVYVLMAFFHDAVYLPRLKDNEEQSAELYRRMCQKSPPAVFSKVYAGILDTKDHTAKPSSPESEVFLRFDINNLIYGSLTDMVADERKLFREFGFVDFLIYKEVRSGILKKFAPYVNGVFPGTRFNEYINWFDNINSPRIAVYSGSFNPFHLGHLDILHKAEQMFDKVIVQIGKNPAKANEDLQARADRISALLPNNQVMVYDGMLFALEAQLGYPVTIVKGLRNEDDFKSEKMQLRFTEDYNPNVKMTFIVGDRELEHVSSSALRMLNQFGPDTSQYLPS